MAEQEAPRSHPPTEMLRNNQELSEPTWIELEDCQGFTATKRIPCQEKDDGKMEEHSSPLPCAPPFPYVTPLKTAACTPQWEPGPGCGGGRAPCICKSLCTSVGSFLGWPEGSSPVSASPGSEPARSGWKSSRQSLKTM